MRVAMLAPIAWRTPPRHYGPWEQVVSLLTEGLVARGVDVTLFATGDSETSGRLVSVCPRGYEEDRSLDPKVCECLHISKLFENGDRFDLIHNHFDFLPLTYTGMTSTPVVTTIHGFSSEKIVPVYRKYDGRVFYVSISSADRHPDLTYEATIHHGIDLRRFTFRDRPDDYLLFFGRIHPDKGTADAVEIARRAGRKLILAGIVQDEAYFQREVEPRVDGRNVVYVGAAGAERRDELLGGALALLHPIHFREPFGLSVVEAMACGTPVIAFDRGSMRELIVDGETGFLCSSADQAVEAVRRVGDLHRAACRRRVEERFTSDRMVERYIELYRRILQRTAREDHRPWGYYQVLSDRPNHKVKRIVVEPGARLSLQRHRLRAEHWYVVSGMAEVTLDGRTLALGPGGAADIPRGTWHRIRNAGDGPLVFVEVQTGDSFDENDIERREDDYGRVA